MKKIIFLEDKLLDEIYTSNGLLRIFMGSEQIKLANRLVKEGYLSKGINPIKKGTTIFNITDKGINYLDSVYKR